MNGLLPQVVRQRMAELGLSFRKADAACGLPSGSISSVIYGGTQRPKPETLQAIAQGLDLSYRELALAAYGLAEASA